MAAGDPYGEDLCTITVNLSDLSVYGWVDFDLSPNISIESGSKYAVVVGTSSVVSQDAAEWRQLLSDVYPGGLKCISDDSGETWTQYSTRDCGFRCYAGDTLKDNYGSSDPSFWMFGPIQYIYDPYYIAQTFTAASSYVLTKVALPLGKGDDDAGYPGTLTISIRNVSEAPGKAQNPTPSDDQEGVYIRGIDRLRTLSWDAPS